MPLEPLSPLRPLGQTPARAEDRPAARPERSRAERATGTPAKADGVGQNLDVLA